MIALSAVVACAGSPTPPAPTPPPAAEAPSVLVGLCDASGAVEVGGRWLVVADDEHDLLRVFDRDLRPAGTIDLGPLDPALAGPDEADLEAMTTATDGTVWVIGSHDPGKETVPKVDRGVLFPLHLTASDSGVTAALAGPVDTSRAVVAPVAVGTEGRTAKDPQGLSIEGLAWRDGGLEVGFRAPVRAGRAAVVRAGPGGYQATWLDLGGRGIRSLEEDLVLAGGEPGFALFRLRDGVPELLDVDFGDLNPEALVHRSDGWWVLSDDGKRDVSGEECRKLPESRRSARLTRLSLPGPRG